MAQDYYELLGVSRTASADDITQGLPRVQELFEARTPKGSSPIAEAAGRITIEETDKTRKIILTPDNGDEAVIYPVLKRSTLLVADGDHVELRASGEPDAHAKCRSTSSVAFRACTARRVCRFTTSTLRSSFARCSAR